MNFLAIKLFLQAMNIRKKNIYILREKKRESEKHLKVKAFYFIL